MLIASCQAEAMDHEMIQVAACVCFLAGSYNVKFF